MKLTENGIKIIKEAIKTVGTFDKTFFEILVNETGSFNHQLLTLLKQKK